MTEQDKRIFDHAIFYHIYPLGLCGAPAANDFVSQPVNRLDRLLDWIPHIRELGGDALYLGPVFESDFHGYDTADYFVVDRRLGTNEHLKELSEALHDAGIRLVLDTVFNHVGRNFWAFKDLQANGQASRYKDWFCSLDFTRQSTYGDPFYYEGWYDAYNLVRLNLSNPEVRYYLCSVVDFWIREFDIDGLRLDVAEIMDRNFLVELAMHCRRQMPGIWLLGEMITGDYCELANPGMLNSVTNYELYEALCTSHNHQNYTSLSNTLLRQSGANGHYRDLRLYTFADNHDTSRIASLLHHPEHLHLVYTLLLTLPGIPSIYYGSEWGIKGIKGAHEDTALRPEVSKIPDVSKDALFHYIQQLIALRRQHTVLSHGAYQELYATEEQLIFCRAAGNDFCIVAVNLSAEPASITLQAPDLLPQSLFDLLEQDLRLTVSGGVLKVDIPSHGSRIFVPILQ